VHRSGHSAAMTVTVRAPQSNPARIADSICKASISATMSSATADCCAFRNVSFDRKTVGPYPRRYGTMTRYPAAASSGPTSICLIGPSDVFVPEPGPGSTETAGVAVGSAEQPASDVAAIAVAIPCANRRLLIIPTLRRR
jgi:hypothetical protein